MVNNSTVLTNPPIQVKLVSLPSPKSQFRAVSTAHSTVIGQSIVYFLYGGKFRSYLLGLFDSDIFGIESNSKSINLSNFHYRLKVQI